MVCSTRSLKARAAQQDSEVVLQDRYVTGTVLHLGLLLWRKCSAETWWHFLRGRDPSSSLSNLWKEPSGVQHVETPGHSAEGEMETGLVRRRG